MTEEKRFLEGTESHLNSFLWYGLSNSDRVIHNAGKYKTRTVLKKVKRFLLVGRVVKKKLTRATQQKLVANMESRQRSTSTAAAISQMI